MIVTKHEIFIRLFVECENLTLEETDKVLDGLRGYIAYKSIGKIKHKGGTITVTSGT